MLQRDVKVGHAYTMRVSGVMTTVFVVGFHRPTRSGNRAKLVAVNMASGREVGGTAARFRAEVDLRRVTPEQAATLPEPWKTRMRELRAANDADVAAPTAAAWSVGDVAEYVAGPPGFAEVGERVEVVHVGVSAAADRHLCATIRNARGAEAAVYAGPRNLNIRPLAITARDVANAGAR